MISIIVPVYNAERTIEKTLSSILEQSYQEFEILVIDDGSVDTTYDLCMKKYGNNSKIRIVRIENSGVSTARNIGLGSALGEYVTFCDADDYWDKNFLSDMLDSLFESNVIPVCAYYTEYIDRRKVSSISLSSNNVWIDFIIKSFTSGHFNQVWNKLYDLKIIQKYNILFRKELSLGEDFFFNMDYLQFSKYHFTFINKPLYHYVRTQNESLDNRYNQAFLVIQKEIFDAMIEFCINNGAEDKVEILYCRYFDALVVAIDNLYLSKNFTKKIIGEEQKSVLCDNKFDYIVNMLHGFVKIFYKVRLNLLRGGFYTVDYTLREIAKKIL